MAVLVAAARPDLVERLVCVAGPFHKEGWLPEAIAPTLEPPEFFATGYGQVSPDGIEHFLIVTINLRLSIGRK